MTQQKQNFAKSMVPGECIIVDFYNIFVNRDISKMRRVMLTDVTFYEECLHDLSNELFFVDLSSANQIHQTPNHSLHTLDFDDM